jgi:hypothetical protein
VSVLTWIIGNSYREHVIRISSKVEKIAPLINVIITYTIHVFMSCVSNDYSCV